MNTPHIDNIFFSLDEISDMGEGLEAIGRNIFLLKCYFLGLASDGIIAAVADADRAIYISRGSAVILHIEGDLLFPLCEDIPAIGTTARQPGLPLPTLLIFEPTNAKSFSGQGGAKLSSS